MKMKTKAIIFSLLAFSLMSCGGSKDKEKTSKSDVISENSSEIISSSSEIESSESESLSSEEEIESSYDESSLESRPDEIPDDGTNLLKKVYNDFNKVKLSNEYLNVKLDSVSSVVSYDSDKQVEFLSNIDCFECEVSSDDSSYLLDFNKNLSKNESYYGNLKGGLVSNFGDYYNELVEYENNTYGENNVDIYLLNSKYLVIKIEATDGSNLDLIVIDDFGLISNINMKSYTYSISNTKTLENGTLSEDDLSLLNSANVRIDDDCATIDYSNLNNIKKLNIVSSYREKIISKLDINTIKNCTTLEEINVVGESEYYSSKDGVLFNSSGSELLFYPQSKLGDEYILPSKCKKIGEEAFSNNINLTNLIINSCNEISKSAFKNSNIKELEIYECNKIADKAFEGMKNLNKLIIPKIDNNLLSYFSDKVIDEMEKFTYDSKTYYIPTNLSYLNILSGDISNDSFLGFKDKIETIILPNTIETIDDNLFKDFTKIKSIVGEGVSEVLNNAFINNTTLEEISFENCTIVYDNAFKNCNNLKTVDLENVKSICESAFEDCINIEEINLSKCENISDKAFMISNENIEYSKLKTVTVKNLKEVGKNAFTNCVKLENINLDTVEIIYDNAFKNCIKLTSINLLSCTDAGPHAFESCKGLITVNVPLLNKISSNMFADCKELESIAGSFELIEEYSFKNCGKLTDINLSDTKEICMGAFFYCTSLEYADLSNLENIEDASFKGCSSLFSNNSETNELNMPNLKKSAGSVFYSCTNLQYVNLGSLETITYGMFACCNSLKLVKGIENVTTIENNAFENCTSYVGCINDIDDSSNDIFYEKLLSIGESSFKNCQNMNLFRAPYCKTIDYNAFGNCKNLTHVNLPDATNINGRIFEGCESLYSLYVGLKSFNSDNIADLKLFNQLYLYCNSIDFKFTGFNKLETLYCYYAQSICDEAFKDLTNLTSVSLSNVTTIGSYAFYNSGLKYFNGNSVTSVGEYAFAKCSSLQSLTLNKVTKIPDYLCYQSSLLTTLNLNACESIGSNAFNYCKELKQLYLPTVKSLGYRAFIACTGLQTITFDSLETVGEEAFRECMNLTTATINKVTTISDSAFYSCNSLKTVNMNSIKEIDSYAFYNCQSLVNSLNYSNLSSIGQYAFYGCKGITEIYIYGYVGDSAFINSNVSLVRVKSSASLIEQNAINGANVSYLYIESETFIKDLTASAFNKKMTSIKNVYVIIPTTTDIQTLVTNTHVLKTSYTVSGPTTSGGYNTYTYKSKALA